MGLGVDSSPENFSQERNPKQGYYLNHSTQLMNPDQKNKANASRRAKSLRCAVALAVYTLPAIAVAQSAEPKLFELDPLVVTSQAEIQEISLERYRESDAITNVVSSDAIGQFVDQNVAESLHRLPGISITRDQGEGRFVSIRGIESALNTTTVNGMRIGTPEDGNRNLPLDIIPSGTVQILEVTKVPTPDMPGDSIGGAINISTQSAFERKGQEITYSLMGTYSDLTKDLGPKLKVGYSNLIGIGGGEDNFGISFGISYQDRDFGSDNIETEYDYLENEDTGLDVLAPIETQLRMYTINRERLGLSLDLDFSPSDGNEFFLNTLLSQFTDAETRQRSIFIFEDGDLTSSNTGRFEFEDIEEDGFRRRIRFRTQEKEIFAISTGGRHALDNWNIDYLIGLSKATEEVPDEIEGRFEKTGDPLGATVNAGSGIPSFVINNGGVADDSHLRNENYELDRVVREGVDVEETTRNFALNFERLSDRDSLLPKIKFGFDARFTEKEVDITEFELRAVPSLNLADFTSSRRSFPFNNLGDGISSSAFRSYYASNRGDFSERPRDMEENIILNTVQDFEADEDVYAGFLMGTWDWSDWRLIAGTRIERTDFNADGNEIVLDINGDLDSVNPSKGSSKYTNFLPGLHLRYEGFDNMVIRGAWSNTIGRPNFDDLAPNAQINREDSEVTIGNPDLDPYEAANFDLMFDYYLPASGIFSAGIFYKDIDNYIVEFTTTSDPEFPGFEVERPINGTDARVYGLELNWEQQLGEWSDVLEGFLMGVNATFLDTKFKIAERSGETFILPRASEQVFNLYLGYELGRFSTRLSSNWRSEFIDEIGGSKEFDIYVADHNQWDLTFAYRIRPGLELVAEIGNITDEPLELYQGSKGNNLQLEEYGTTYNLGIKGHF